MEFSFYPASGLVAIQGDGSTGAVLGRYRGGRNWKRIIEKTRVGFGRTEVSVRLDGIVVCALSFGHSPRGREFEGI